MTKMLWKEIVNYLNENKDAELIFDGIRGCYMLNGNEIFPENHTLPEEIQLRLFGMIELYVPEQTEKPPPGLELDKLIAEKVLGWYQDSVIGGPRDWWYEKGIEKNTLYLNHYSTDIKAAWDLVEKFKLCVVPWGGQWTATLHGQIYVDGERNLAPTAPHAICLAALFYASEDETDD